MYIGSDQTSHAVCSASLASNSAILFSSSARAGVLGAALAISAGDMVPSSSVTHPSVAVATHWMYLKRIPALARSGGGVHSCRRFSHSSSGINTSMVRLSFWASMRMGSPFLTRAMGPPTWASGVMCPMQNPCVPPLNRPSVNSATSFPRPAPMMALVGVSISGRPGPPVGPSYRIMTTSPFLISLFLRPSIIRGSLSYTRAVPVKVSPSFPVILATPPPGQRFPYIMSKWPVFLMGSSRGRMISCPGVSPGCSMSARFWFQVFPVTVIWSPSNMPLSIMNLMTPGVPPMFCTSSMTNFPDGLRSAKKGVTSEMR
mmetsp:Transcript_20682/g.48643  ORF Transcript_20682/g.48643 Transcript_20682/m.48643 type:complete len:315 (-) Transcript_20682:1451-2395(-)